MTDYEVRTALKVGAELARVTPTLADTFAAVEAIEPATVMDVLHHLGLPWQKRGTVRNRLAILTDYGDLISDEHRPERFAVNHLRPTP